MDLLCFCSVLCLLCLAAAALLHRSHNDSVDPAILSLR